jgi:hypothetical protein
MMTKFYFLTIFIFITFLNDSLGQRIERPDKLKPLDFSKRSDSIDVMFQRTLVTFPFEENKSSGEVTDQQFKLSIESIIRIRLNRIASTGNFVLLPNIFAVDPKIRSIEYSYLENNKIKNRKIQDSEIILEKSDSVSFINFANIMKDSVVIIDIFYSLITHNKENIMILKNEKTYYQNMKISIEIPGIYTYKYPIIADCLDQDLKSKTGGIRGYQNVNSPNASVTGKIIVDVLKKDFPNANFQAVYLRINSHTYTLTENCLNFVLTNDAKVLKLKLNKITPIIKH